MTSTSDIATDFAFFAKKYKTKLPIFFNEKKKKRTCYNCDEDSHFANECPYEKRVGKPKFVKGVKPRLKPNPINDRYKKNKGRAFVGAEYTSEEEEDDDEKEAGVASLAFAKPGSLFTYDYSKDYSAENDVGSSFMARTTHDDDSSSSTVVGSCLMARETKVMESPPSLSSILDDDETENQEELAMLKELYNVRCTLRVKDLETIERAQLLAQELDASKKELEVAHASLTRDLDHLERANKLVKDELKKLGENHDILQETYKKALGSMNDPIVVEKVASSSTSFTCGRRTADFFLPGMQLASPESACEQATILEENARLTKELAKFTTVKNKMELDDLLSKQRSNNQKNGLGYAPKPYKKNIYKKEKPAQDKNKKGYSSGGPKWVFDSGCTNHMTGGRGVLDQFIEDIKKKSSITFGDNSKGKVLGSDNLKLVLVGYVENNLYVVDLSKESPSPSTCLMAAKHDEGKQLKKKHPIKSIVTTSRPLELLHLDLFGPSHYDTLGGSKYGLVIVDDYSRYSWVFLLKSKDETHREFITFAKKAQRMYESEIKAIRTDNGTEFKNYTMQEFVDDEGIKHECRCLFDGTPEEGSSWRGEEVGASCQS
ncbi:hypothetical protein QYE76_003189 [Lolium multiflorum]|uniref:Uncharacterized protein n=1 Tax=Lolium multiflorum TaxID=4521 RepID=A0AAD8RPP5_LOLMU|nr:hypothetical protein QYE76_003189 [Lolium multiflorum]